MGLETNLKITCDYAECGGQNKSPVVVSWNKENVESGKVAQPPEAAYLVLFTHNGVLKTFCGQLHAAMYFLPPGYEVQQKKVVEFPVKGEFGTKLKPECTCSTTIEQVCPIHGVEPNPEGDGA